MEPAQNVVEVWIQFLIVLVQIGEQPISSWATRESNQLGQRRRVFSNTSGIRTKYASDFDQLIIIVLAMEKGLLSKDLRSVLFNPEMKRRITCNLSISERMGCSPCQRACSPNSKCPRNSRTAASPPAELCRHLRNSFPGTDSIWLRIRYTAPNCQRRQVLRK